ncbi:CPBP family intramembrane glutamic endopeptidase [Nocardioides marmotae]|uniref:CPBP family intramembrane glutamic endopeptidase n=1 Tax=Nocardioides marmotae TaxID=2663857 RepID=UPI0012B53011|nr:type II CAAX endopeptidase family protein [Nocardioides marmotae]MBC9735057.1 CPBP family intramembrane metalloprotease [Nocardioides marmotae]MTB86157.1 CPBP family intramembrane metalloprotease [Nocardioides marmotae]
MTVPVQLPPPPVVDDGLTYERLHRLGRPGWWRPVVGVVALVVLVLLLQTVATVVVAVYLLLSGVGVDAALDRLSGDPVTPSFLALVNVGWALAIPAVWLVAYTLHRLRPGTVSSVGLRLRWGWFLACFGVAFVALFLTLVVSALLPSQGAGTEVSTELNEFTRTTRDFALIVLLLTPLQAAGEEYAFRGYLTQAFGGLVRWRWVAVVVPAFIFALAHGLGQDLPIFFDRFAFGLVAGTLVILTGGLEAGIAMHVLNNWLAFGIALAFGDMTSALNPTGGTWWSLPVTLTQSLSFLGLTLLVARAMGVRSTTDRPVLQRRNTRV